ncbi:hypothetical protein ACFVH0_16645 [Streptomyces sp. NPDC127117]|uniref:hypothetical protein n=1 Tax=Streptomyces sp. NPDC127117 TaxID=3345368 RepID=UPI00363CE5DF
MVFGLVHVSNAFGEGAQAIVQALVVSTSGYFFCRCLRVGGIILLPMLVHGLRDTSLISNLVGDMPQASVGMALLILLQITLIVVLLVKRHEIEAVPPAQDDLATGPNPSASGPVRASRTPTQHIGLGPETRSASHHGDSRPNGTSHLGRHPSRPSRSGTFKHSNLVLHLPGEVHRWLGPGRRSGCSAVIGRTNMAT